MVKIMLWCEILRIATGSNGWSALERAIEPEGFLRAKERLFHHRHWYAYEKGIQEPGPERRQIAATFCPFAQAVWEHVFWETLKTDIPLGRRTNHLLRRISPRIEALLFEKLPTTSRRRRPVTIGLLTKIEYELGLDALATLTILLREAIEKKDDKLARRIVGSILRVLLVYSTTCDGLRTAPRIYYLFRTRIFPIAISGPMQSEFDGYNFNEAARTLLDRFLMIEDAEDDTRERCSVRKQGRSGQYILGMLKRRRWRGFQLRLLAPLHPWIAYSSLLRQPQPNN